jgi:exosortase
MENTILSKISKADMALWLLLGLGFVVCYYPTFQWLNYKYSTPDSYYSHGYLIPFVILYLIYDKRNELKGLPISSNILGLIVALFALIIHIIGVLSDVSFISGFSIIAYCIGLSLYLLGTTFTRHIIFPLAYLLFMMPVPDEYLGIVALPSKSAATWFALKILDLINVPYIREGFSIVLANATFIVGTPCNGLRSLISFLALGVLLIYFMRMNFFKSIFLLAIIPLMAVLLNGARIVILLLIAIYYGQEAASPESFLHDASGLFVFVAGLVIMIIAVKVLYGKKTA